MRTGHSSASPSYKPVGASTKPALFTSRDKMLRQATHRSSIPTSASASLDSDNSPSAFADPPKSAKYLPKTPTVKVPNPAMTSARSDLFEKGAGAAPTGEESANVSGLGVKNDRQRFVLSFEGQAGLA